MRLMIRLLPTAAAAYADTDADYAMLSLILCHIRDATPSLISLPLLREFGFRLLITPCYITLHGMRVTLTPLPPDADTPRRFQRHIFAAIATCFSPLRFDCRHFAIMPLLPLMFHFAADTYDVVFTTLSCFCYALDRFVDAIVY